MTVQLGVMVVTQGSPSTEVNIASLVSLRGIEKFSQIDDPISIARFEVISNKLSDKPVVGKRLYIIHDINGDLNSSFNPYYFGGVIVNVKEKWGSGVLGTDTPGSNTNRGEFCWVVTVQDYARWLLKKKVTQTYTGKTLPYVVNDLLTNYNDMLSTTATFFYASVMPPERIVPNITFDDLYLLQCFEKLKMVEMS